MERLILNLSRLKKTYVRWHRLKTMSYVTEHKENYGDYGKELYDLYKTRKINFEHFKLRPLKGRYEQISDLAKTGDSEKKQLLAEYTLEVRNEAAHGILLDVNQ